MFVLFCNVLLESLSLSYTVFYSVFAAVKYVFFRFFLFDINHFKFYLLKCQFLQFYFFNTVYFGVISEHLISSGSKKIFILIWGYALFWTGAPLVGWNSYTKEAYGTSCTIDWTSQSMVDKTYSATIIITCFLVHLVIFIYCYGNIISNFRRANTIKLNQESDGAIQNTSNEPVQVETIVWYHKIITSRQLTIVSMN